MTDKQRQGRSNKRKGYYYESKAVAMALAVGLDAKRVYASGRIPGLPDDLVIEHEQYEVKSRKAGFAFDEILDDPTIAGLVTFSTAKRGLAPRIRLRYQDYLLLKGALKQNKHTIETQEKNNYEWAVAFQAVEAKLKRKDESIYKWMRNGEALEQEIHQLELKIEALQQPSEEINDS